MPSRPRFSKNPGGFPTPIVLQELLALTEQFAAGAIEDCNFIPKEGAHGIPIREEVETKTKDRLEHLELAMAQDHVRSCHNFLPSCLLALNTLNTRINRIQ